MSHDSDYLKRRAQEKIRKNIIKWWNVSIKQNKNYVGSLELEDPNYGCHVYTPSKQYLQDKELEEQLLLEENMEDLQDLETDTTLSNDVPVTEGINPDEEDEALRLANEIFERLTREADADEAAKQAEIEAAKQAAAGDENFNASTGSYSGLYGQTPMSSEEADSFASIMSTNSSFNKSIEDLIRENQQ